MNLRKEQKFGLSPRWSAALAVLFFGIICSVSMYRGAPRPQQQVYMTTALVENAFGGGADAAIDPEELREITLFQFNDQVQESSESSCLLLGVEIVKSTSLVKLTLQGSSEVAVSAGLGKVLGFMREYYGPMIESKRAAQHERLIGFDSQIKAAKGLLEFSKANGAKKGDGLAVVELSARLDALILNRMDFQHRMLPDLNRNLRVIKSRSTVIPSPADGRAGKALLGFVLGVLVALGGVIGFVAFREKWNAFSLSQQQTNNVDVG